MGSPRSGDIVLLANYSNADGYPNYFISSVSNVANGEHGNLNPEDSFVPLVFSGPGIAHDTLTSARNIDIAPTIANLLGFEMRLNDKKTGRTTLRHSIQKKFEIRYLYNIHSSAKEWVE